MSMKMKSNRWHGNGQDLFWRLKVKIDNCEFWIRELPNVLLNVIRIKA